MAKHFDASMKMLVEEYPADWVAWLGFPDAPVEVIDADLATVSAATDKVVRVGRGKNQWLLLVEMLASYKPFIPERTHFHSTLLSHRHTLPVRSVIVLLRPEADGPAMTGRYQEACPGNVPYLSFRYQVVRLWQIPAATILKGGIGLLPLAGIAEVNRADLPSVIHQMRTRIDREVPSAKAAELKAATYVLMGLRYDIVVIDALRQEVVRMEESITYQEIVGIGKLDEVKKLLIRQGTKKFAKRSKKAEKVIALISDLERLEQLSDRLLDVDSWDELLAGS